MTEFGAKTVCMVDELWESLTEGIGELQYNFDLVQISIEEYDSIRDKLELFGSRVIEEHTSEGLKYIINGGTSGIQWTKPGCRIMADMCGRTVKTVYTDRDILSVTPDCSDELYSSLKKKCNIENLYRAKDLEVGFLCETDCYYGWMFFENETLLDGYTGTDAIITSCWSSGKYYGDLRSIANNCPNIKELFVCETWLGYPLLHNEPLINNCEQLETLIILDSVDIRNLFKGCPKLKKLILASEYLEYGFNKLTVSNYGYLTQLDEIILDERLYNMIPAKVVQCLSKGGVKLTVSDMYNDLDEYLIRGGTSLEEYEEIYLEDQD